MIIPSVSAGQSAERETDIKRKVETDGNKEAGRA